MAGSKRSWGSLRRLRSGRWQAKFLDPDTHLLTPAPQTFASKSAADRWLARKRAELDTGTATDEKAGGRPLAEWWSGYWRSVQAHKARTKAGYEAAWRLRIEPRFGATAGASDQASAHRRLDRGDARAGNVGVEDH